MDNPVGSTVSALVAAVRSALGGGFTQHQRILRLSLPGLSDVLLAESLRGEEGLSRGFVLEVAALSLDANIPLKSLLGQPALLELRSAHGPGGMRPFHGHVSAAEVVGSNGGFARYKLTIEPWLSFLRLGRDSRIFQDNTVLDILETVFQAYDGKGKLAPSWRLDIANPAVYAKRSLTTQYQESDLAFVERLMSEEGLFYFFEHTGDAASPGLGRHTLVIADHNNALQPNPQADVRFTQPGTVMKEDSMDRWRTESRAQTSALKLSSWDYRSRDLRPASASTSAAVELTYLDTPGAYAYQTTEHGERIAARQLEALLARQEIHTGAGTVRDLAAGTTFTLHGHSKYDGGDDARFTIVRVVHLAHNNLNADTANSLERLLGDCPVKQASLAELAGSLHAVGRKEGERPVYRNRIDAIPASRAYRSAGVDERGVILHPRPIMRGQQTAIVVGAGGPIHTDRDHRIKVQFHWQRGDASHSRLAHPQPEGQTGAPADDQAGTWVRVATPLAPIAGSNWGGNALPRVGQEVLIDFIDGNIDKPVVIGSLYNGGGATDAQHNQVSGGGGSATGNAPVWFPGKGGAHAHAAVLSGLKSQAMAASQRGGDAYSQLVFDDTAGEPRLALQRHAMAHTGTDELNLGHLRHQTDNQRLDPAGFGAELKTEHGAALRAAQGMLLSTDARRDAGSTQLDSSEAQAQIGASLALQQAMAETAQKHNAKLKDEPAPAEIPAILQLEAAGEVLGAQADRTPGEEGGGAGAAVAYSRPQLQLSSPSGIAALTPASAIVAAGTTTGLTAGHDINFAAQANSFYQVEDGISLFTYGKASVGTKPNQETGIRLHAASGKLSTQSQSDVTRITADKMITVASISKTVTVAAKDHVLMTAQGAYIKLIGGNIEVHGPGTMSFKAGMKELTGPSSSPPDLPLLPRHEFKYAQKFQLKDTLGLPLANQAYTVYVSDQQEIKGKTDAQGMTQLIDTENSEQTYIIFDRDLRWVCEEEDDDTDICDC